MIDRLSLLYSMCQLTNVISPICELILLLTYIWRNRTGWVVNILEILSWFSTAPRRLDASAKFGVKCWNNCLYVWRTVLFPESWGVLRMWFSRTTSECNPKTMPFFPLVKSGGQKAVVTIRAIWMQCSIVATENASRAALLRFDLALITALLHVCCAYL